MVYGHDTATGTDTDAATDTEALIEAHIHSKLGSRLSRLRVVCRGGGVVLRGNAHTYHVKQLAQHAAAEVTDLPVVANEIAVCWLERRGSLVWAAAL